MRSDTSTIADKEGDLAALADGMKRWLFDDALPLWWEHGSDPAGGFYESLDLDGRPTHAPRRMRVQARQSFVYALAGELGWQGPWPQAAEHGLRYLDARYRNVDGFYCTLTSADGAVADAQIKTYDQAFVLLALAQLQKTGLAHLEPERRALDLLSRLLRNRHHEDGGFREQSERQFLSNPNMHMLEACLAWCQVSQAPVWHRLADEVADLAALKLACPAQGLPEYFDSAWTPDVPNRVEPGHQFEWAWLLATHPSLSRRYQETAADLYASGARGVDVERGVAVDVMNDPIAAAPARLWPQTERARTALRLARVRGPNRAAYLADALAAAELILRYLDTPRRGLWRDRMRPDGAFDEEPAPASSLYHIVAWIKELQAFRDHAAARPIRRAPTTRRSQ